MNIVQDEVAPAGGDYSLADTGAQRVQKWIPGRRRLWTAPFHGFLEGIEVVLDISFVYYFSFLGKRLQVCLETVPKSKERIANIVIGGSTIRLNVNLPHSIICMDPVNYSITGKTLKSTHSKLIQGQPYKVEFKSVNVLGKSRRHA